ncbi:MAG: Wzz/FepE/Etk N-terminal domain-containing protein [Anaerolineae bacterium]
MNLADFARILIRRGWIILLVAALTGVSALFSKLQTPIYRATQQILVKPARPDNEQHHHHA